MNRFLQRLFAFLLFGMLSMSINAQTSTYINDTICYGEDYFDYGFAIINPPVGIVYDNLYFYDQDSTVYLNLTVNPTYDILINDTINLGEDYIDNGFCIIQPEEGILMDTLFLASIYGCDSIVMLNLMVLPVTGLNEDNITSSINFYPNPTQNNVIVECEGLMSITIINSLDQVVNKISKINNNSCLIDINDYPDGIYYLQIQTKEGYRVSKVIKQH